MPSCARASSGHIGSWRQPSGHHGHRLKAVRGAEAKIASPAAGWIRLWDDPLVRTLLAHVAAASAILVMVLLTRPGALQAPSTIVGFSMAAGIGLLHGLTVTKAIRSSTIAFDAIGTAVVVAGTGGAHSPFFLLAFAGGWWAAHLPRRRSGLEYVTFFVAAYAVLVAGTAWREGSMARFVEDVIILLVLGALSHQYVKVDRRAIELSEAMQAPEFGPEQLGFRQRLARALRAPDLPVDAVIAAGHLGLTAQQAELMGHLVIGLTNREIADALGLSEAAVRYRLTRLYRALGVPGRQEAAARALALGLTGLTSPRVDPAPAVSRTL
jgi:DNA-binding CsgD family transcriptional regulator